MSEGVKKNLRDKAITWTLCGHEYSEICYKLSGHFVNDEIAHGISTILHNNQMDEEVILRQAPTGVMVIGRMIKLLSVNGYHKMTIREVSYLK